MVFIVVVLVVVLVVLIMVVIVVVIVVVMVVVIVVMVVLVVMSVMVVMVVTVVMFDVDNNIMSCTVFLYFFILLTIYFILDDWSYCSSLMLAYQSLQRRNCCFIF